MRARWREACSLGSEGRTRARPVTSVGEYGGGSLLEEETGVGIIWCLLSEVWLIEDLWGFGEKIEFLREKSGIVDVGMSGGVRLWGEVVGRGDFRTKLNKIVEFRNGKAE